MGDARQGQDWIGVLWSVTCLLEGLGLPFWVISGVFPCPCQDCSRRRGGRCVWVEWDLAQPQCTPAPCHKPVHGQGNSCCGGFLEAKLFLIINLQEEYRACV